MRTALHLVAVLAAVAISSDVTEAQSSVDKLQYLFDRPSEPVFLPKIGDKSNKQVYLQVPDQYLTDRQKKLGMQVINRFGEKSETIKVKQINVPDLSYPGQLGVRAQFSTFMPEHRKMAARLVQIFMGMRTLEDFFSAAVYARNHLNPYLFMYAYSVALMHRPDTKDSHLPPLPELFPEKFISGGVFAQVREEANTVRDPQQRIPIEIPKDYTASDLEEEHRVAYFREDVGINSMHWQWHLVYPATGPMEIVRKDRRGELNWYFHEQILARYNAERFSNGLQRVKRLLDLREPIAEGYFPKMDSLVSSRTWPARPANTKLSDINRPVDGLQFDLATMERWRDRIYKAIHEGAVDLPDGRRQNLTEFEGIDLLGNIIESNVLSVNEQLYGNVHAFGHVAIGFAHDPDHRHLEQFGVMGDPSTTMRDPVFYRWHSFIDDIAEEHKRTLRPYTQQQLDFPGVQIKNVEVTTAGSRRPNELLTHWQQTDMDLSRGLDFVEDPTRAQRGSLFIRVTHLQHRPFSYRIQVDSPRQGEGMVRIFMAPKMDEKGVPMQFRDQRLFMMELDRFPTNLRQGSNTIERRSTQSSVTIPFARTFRNVDRDRPTDGAALDQFNFCGCGWPHHLLIPKGNAAGMAFQLFVMITDYSKDKVDQRLNPNDCNDAYPYCGVRKGLYPDKQPMGFPFDRVARPGVDSLRSFLTRNMFIQDFTIKFQDITEAPARNGTASRRP